MRGTNARSAVACTGLGLLLCGILLVTEPGTAGILDATWTAPTTNTDGSPLTDLASYWLYYGTSSSPCPGSSSIQVASPTSSPGPNQTISVRLTGLTTGTLYNVAVSAVDATGKQSACSSIASAVARAEFAVSPAGTVSFGSVNLGSFAEQTFTVSNTGGGTVSGSASVAAPFSIVFGSPFTLGGVGATQAVTVRFTPTTTTTVSTTLTFTAGGGTITAIVTGSGASTDTTRPSVAITSPAAGTTVAGAVVVSATATDNVGVAGVQFKLDGANVGAEVTTAPYAVTWNTTTTADGAHALTAVARDAAGNTATSAGVTVTVANATYATATGAIDVTAPVISKVSLSVMSSGAAIGWTTNEPSDTQVEYGLTQSYGSLTPLKTTLVTSHSQVINSLAPNTWYHFRLRSRDAAGNLGVSGDYKFKTRAH
jgi:Big-like domain-containing protein/ASPM-SPD-2-Hydin domain-containing protein